jgi:hypothetical protein
MAARRKGGDNGQMRWVLPLVLCGAACTRAVGPPISDTLLGLTLPLSSGPSLRLAVQGSLGGAPVEVDLDVGAPISVISSGCPGLSATAGTAHVVDAVGGDTDLPVARVEGLTLADRRFHAFDAVVANRDDCSLSLGGAPLAHLAVVVSPERRTVSLQESRPREAWLAEAQSTSEDVQLVDLTRDPRHDWPLLPVRVVQGPASMTATFVLSTRERVSRVYEVAAREAGLSAGLELLAGLPMPSGLVIPPELKGLQGVAYDRLELSPGYGVELGTLKLEAGAPAHGVAGILGADAWGRFDASIDLDASLLVLRRPRTLNSGSRTQCDRQGQLSEESCFSLNTAHEQSGIVATSTIWKPLREGGRVYLDVVPAASLSCRIGFTFSPGDRGRSTQHHFPWNRLFLGMRGCADALAQATDVRLGLYEEGNLKECPGVCAFAQDLNTGRVSCECQPGVNGGGGEMERRFLEFYRQLLELNQEQDNREPEDPP